MHTFIPHHRSCSFVPAKSRPHTHTHTNIHTPSLSHTHYMHTCIPHHRSCSSAPAKSWPHTYIHTHTHTTCIHSYLIIEAVHLLLQSHDHICQNRRRRWFSSHTNHKLQRLAKIQSHKSATIHTYTHTTTFTCMYLKALIFQPHQPQTPAPGKNASYVCMYVYMYVCSFFLAKMQCLEKHDVFVPQYIHT